MFEPRRYGVPRTEAERAARHEALYGTGAELPERGFGLRREEAAAVAGVVGAIIGALIGAAAIWATYTEE